ncbi:MAG TPA: antibiotic biosynthesis monooxygenase family protein [Geothrix sp.]|nr:antibiotic biosynthesis monooxygenase family protein [Geothrix sp.]
MKQQFPGEEKILTALMTAKPEKRDELIQTLRLLLDEARHQAGCLDCMVGQDLGNEPRFILYLVWKDLAALETYMGSESFRILLGASSTLASPMAFHFEAVDGLRTGRGAPPQARDPVPEPPLRSAFS